MISIVQAPPSIVPPWKHQEEMTEFVLRRRGSLLHVAMGGGKTRATLDAIEELASSGKPCTAIIVTPPPPVTEVWPAQMALYVRRSWVVANLDRRSIVMRAERLAAAKALADRDFNGRLLIVTNYEACFREPLATQLLRLRPRILICDESHKAKAPGGKTSGYLARLGAFTNDHIVGLSGTAMPNGPLDLYGQARFISPLAFPEAINPMTRRPSFARYRARYAVVDLSGKFPRIRGYQRQDEFAACAASFVLRMEKSDILRSLPPELDTEIVVSLSPEARRIYNDLTRELVAEVEGGRVTAANGAVKLLRLNQVTSGFAALDAEGVQSVKRIDEAKTLALTELFDNLPPYEPVVVFARFKEDLHSIERAAMAAGRGYAELSGARKELDHWRETPNEPSILGVQIQAGGLSIDLTRACYAVYFSATFDRALYEQSRARVHRPPQARPVTYYHLIARGTIDSYIYAALKKKTDIVEECLNLISSSSRTDAHAASPEEVIQP